MATPVYCDTQDDLFDVFPDIGKYQEKNLLRTSDFTLASGKTNTYEARGTGYCGMVFDNGQQLTDRDNNQDDTDITAVESNAGSFVYLRDQDRLYVHAVDSDNLTTATPPIEYGEDWDGLKDRCRDASMEEMDAVLGMKYSVPFLPRITQTHTSDDYATVIRELCAYLTCWRLVRRHDPGGEKAEQLRKVAWNPNPEVGEPKGIMNQILDGEIDLPDQISTRKLSSFNVYPYASNTGKKINIYGEYNGSQHQLWRLQIDTAGATGTATWKLSKDGGTNWDATLQDTQDTTNDNRRISLASGLYAFFGDTYALNDYWDIEVFPQSDTAVNPKFFTIGGLR